MDEPSAAPLSSSTDPVPSPPPLDYAERPRLSRRRLLRALALLGGVAGGFELYRRRRSLAKWFELARLRHATLTHEIAPDAVLTVRPGDTEGAWPGLVNSRYAASDRSWARAENRLAPPLQAMPGSMSTLFLHERVSPAGHRRVVALNLSASWQETGVRLHVDLCLFEPGTVFKPRFVELNVKEDPGLRSRGSIPGFPGTLISLGEVPWGSDFRLGGGRPDPRDRSRFLIDYVHNGVPGTIVGQLDDDDTVRLRHSDGGRLPLPLPAPESAPVAP